MKRESIKTAKRSTYYSNRNAHMQLVLKTKDFLLSEKYPGQDARLIAMPPFPDLILVDFAKKRVIGIEVSKTTYRQRRKKERHYKGSDFDDFLIVQFVAPTYESHRIFRLKRLKMKVSSKGTRRCKPE